MTAQMWFGTLERMRWVDAPQPGADMSPLGWNANGTLLNGGGYSANSWGSHGQFQFSWSGGFAQSAAQMMQAYSDGSYGRGLIYFINPLAYHRNILPKHWADPSMGLNYEAPSLRHGVIPTSTPTVDPDQNDLPVTTTVYDLTSVDAGYPGDADSLFIPVPPGMTLLLGGFYSTTGTGGVFYSTDTAGTIGSATALPQFANDASDLVGIVTSGTRGVRLWVGKTESGAASVSITALTARLVDTLSLVSIPGNAFGEGAFGEGPFGGTYDLAPHISGPWVPGMGNTGCRFVGKPTYLPNSPNGGGQAGYSMTLKEVGAWLY